MNLRPSVIALCFLLVSPVTGIWWAVSSQVLTDPHVMCRRTRRLKPRLADTCRREPGLVKELAKGAQMGTRECQYQFRNRRWNCTTANKSLVLRTDSRESGFVNAIAAAGLTYAVTQACSTGALPDCECDKRAKGRPYSTMSTKQVNKHLQRRKNEAMEMDKHPDETLPKHTTPKGVPSSTTNWKWGGCSDNVHYGVRKSREWMDASLRKRPGDLKRLVMLHNTHAGRLAVKNHMREECKCHGLSGSCTLSTCWRKMAPFRDIGNRLKEHFDGAIKVLPSNDGRKFMAAGDASIKPPEREDLVYSEESPDFCRYNPRTGSLGTQGRACNDSFAGVGGCDLLCCGRGHDTKHVKDKFNCRCRFRWCCEVTCDTCNERRALHTCR